MRFCLTGKQDAEFAEDGFNELKMRCKSAVVVGTVTKYTIQESFWRLRSAWLHILPSQSMFVKDTQSPISFLCQQLTDLCQ